MIKEEQEKISGICTEMIEPEEDNDRIIPEMMKLFKNEGYHVTIIETDERNLINILKNMMTSYYNFTVGLSVRNPDFEEGDEVTIKAHKIGERELYVSPHPFKTTEKQ